MLMRFFQVHPSGNRSGWLRGIGVAWSCIGLTACVAPDIEIRKDPLPGSPTAHLNDLDGPSRNVLGEAGLNRLFRKDPVTALRALKDIHDESPDEGALVALAHFCYELGADRTAASPESAAACYLDAARLAYPGALEMAPSGPELDLRRIYNDSCAQLACLLQGAVHDWNHTQVLEGPLSSHHLRLRTGAPGLVQPQAFDQLAATDRLELRHAKLERRYRDGVGGSLLGERSAARVDPLEAAFVPTSGLVIPINATLEFQPTGNRVELVMRDLTQIDRAVVTGRQVPLTGEWSAGLAYLYKYAPTTEAGFEAMIRPAKFESATNLYQLTPYQPDKIPLIFVHGLMSSPETWIKMISVLGSDPVLLRNYQPLVFRYPSGYSIGHNAAALRSKLAAFQAMAEARGGGEKLRRMVLIGHSMGGILANIQIRSSGQRIRDLYLEKPIEELALRPEEKSQLRDVLIFESVPTVERAIFIAAPHRGSEMANNALGRLGSRLIHVPIDLYNTGLTITQLERITGLSPIAVQGLESRPDSIKSLSPGSVFLAEVVQLPVASRTAYHSIIGQADPSDSVEEGSDGVVPYWSSHLEGVSSEKIVDATHTTITKHPDAIEEVRRLLYSHLALPAPSPSPPTPPATGRDSRSESLGHPARR